MEELAFNLRRDIIGYDEFCAEFDEIWTDLMADRQAVTELGISSEIKESPRPEVFTMHRSAPSSGLGSGLEQVIVKAVVSGASGAIVKWIIERITRGRPATAIQPADPPPHPDR